MKITRPEKEGDSDIVTQLKKDLVSLHQSSLHTLELGTGDKNEIYRLLPTLSSEAKIRVFDLTTSKIF